MTSGLVADLSVRRGAFALEARLEVAPGETVAVLGPNGAGKSTLLAALAGLIALDEGGVSLDDMVLEDTSTGAFMAPEHRPIGVVFQDYLLFPHLSAVDNVAFGLRSRGMKRSAARSKAASWLQRLGLAEYASVKPDRLSGGQAQRVALARALVVEPRLLLLDEPLAALDASTRAETRRDLRQLLSEYDGVRIVVTHDPVEAAALADRLVVFEGGRIVQSGTADEIRAHPRSRYTADLVGVNLWYGRGDSDRVVIGAGVVVTVLGPVEGEVVAVVHPRSVSLHRQLPEGSPRNVWRGTVATIDRDADRARVQVDGPLAIVAEITTSALDDLALVPGSDVWVSVKATEVTVSPA